MHKSVALVVPCLWALLLLPLSMTYADEAGLKVGATLALSGKLAFIGEAERRGLELAADEINAEAGHRVSLLVEDNQGESKQAVSNAAKFMDVDKVDVLLSAFTHISSPIAALALRKPVLYVYVSSATTIVRQSQKFFRDYYASDDNGHILGVEVRNRVQGNVALVGEINEACDTFFEAFEAELKGSSAVVAGRFDYNSGETDFKTLWLKVRQKGASTAVLCAFRDTQPLMQQLFDLGLEGIRTFHFVGPFFPVSDTAQMRDLYERNRAVSTWYGFVTSSDSPAIQAFVKRFRKKYGEEPRPDSVYTYDLLHMIAAGAQFCPASPERSDCLAKYLGSTTFEGIAGPLRFNTERSSIRPSFLIEVKNGTWQRVH